MSYEVATAYLNILPSFQGLQREIDRAMGGVDTNRAGREAGDGYTSGFKSVAAKLTGVVAGAFAAVKIGDFAKDAIANASDLNEVASKINVVFGEGAAQVQAFGAQGAKALGQTSLQAQNAAATFGVFGKAAGLADKDNADFSTNLAKLATDMASFSNTSPEDAIDALAAGLRGESDPLQRYGVLLNASALQAKALSMGLVTASGDTGKIEAAQLKATVAQQKYNEAVKKYGAESTQAMSAQATVVTTQNALEKATEGTIEPLSDQQKVLAANALIMEQTTDAQGDFARTSGGLANQQRILNAQWEEAKGKIGTAFLPAVTSVVTFMNDRLGPAVDFVSAKVNDFFAIVDGENSSGALGENSVFAKIAQQIYAFQEGGFDSLQIPPFVLESFERLQGVWDKVVAAAIKMWPSIKDIGKSLGEAASNVGVSVWGIFLSLLEDAAGALQDYVVPALDWLAGWMRENPGLVGAVVAAWTGWKVATMAITLVTGGLTAAQTLLNAVMSANPIVLVIAALAALAAALVWAYNNVDWFRAAVDTAWEFIKSASTVLWENFLKPLFERLWEIIQWVADKLVWFWQNIVEPAWEGISSAASDAWENVIQPVLQWLREAISNTGEFFSNLWQTVSDVWTWISDKVTTVWIWIRDNIFAPLQTGISSVGTFFSDLWTTVSNVWTWIGDKIQGIWDNVINPIWTKIKEFITGIGSFFSGIWDGVKGVVSDVKGFIDEITKKIDDFFGKVEQQAQEQGLATGQQTTGGPFSSAGNPLAGMGMYADGGVLPGYAPGVDSIPAMLSPGEGILRPEVVRAFGADTILGWNAAAKKNKFADGGIVGLHSMGAMTGDIIKKAAEDLLGGKRDQILATPLFGGSVAGGLNPSQDPSSFGWQRAQGIVPFDWNGVPFVGGVANGTQGLWTGLMNALVPQIPGGLMSPIWAYENRDNVNSPGRASFHAYGLAADINAPQNPNGASGDGRSGPGVIPAGVARALAAQFGMEWGGDFRDPMHFEIHVSPGQIGGGGIANAAAVGGSGVDRWRSTVLQALSLTGQSSSWAGAVLKQMDSESSGNPQAINLWDRNAMMGIPSKGLMQVIDPTFRSYALPGYNSNIYDPLSNIIASIRYVLGTYPEGLARFNRAQAYAKGGIVPGWGGVDSVPAMLTPGEGVFTGEQTRAIVTHAKAIEAGYSGQAPTLVINLDSSDPLQVAVGQMIENSLERATVELEEAGMRR